jgi:hypothetical protein
MIKESLKSAALVGDMRYSSEGYMIDPCALGSKGAQGMREIGFYELELPCAPLKQTDLDSRRKVRPIQKMINKLFEQFKVGNEIAGYMNVDLLPPGDMNGYDGLLAARLKQISTPKKPGILLREIEDI